MRGIGRTATVVVACALAGALVGCERDPVGPVDPTESPPSTSASPTPTGPTPPVMPEAAKAETAAGAIAFVEHYIALLNVAAATGQVSKLRAASQGCEGCETYASLYEKTYADGGYYKNFLWEPVAPFADVATSPAVVLVDVDTTQTKYKLKAADREASGPASRYKLRFELERSDSGWLVTELALQPTDA